MTFSIVAHCPQTGKIGAATATGGSLSVPLFCMVQAKWELSQPKP
ncbi:hypothetical protein AB6G58_02460 [Providencia huaxiensis]